jgi:hypothetical protein
MKETPFADPYYWSAFILCGRWKTPISRFFKRF